MRLVRFATPSEIKYGILADEIIRSLVGDPFEGEGRPLDSLPSGKIYRLDEVKLLAPCLPSKLVCLGVNYRPHAVEMKHDQLPASPLLFLKPPSAVIGPGEDIVLPCGSTRVDYEGEMAVVIGRRAKNISPENFQDCVLGYTCLNDVTERDQQKADGQWTRAKSYDTFAPVGPWIETAVDPSGLQLETRVNGRIKQSARTSELIFGVPQLVSFISGVMTLWPGDVISTGTPGGIGPLSLGDVVEITIEKIGTLRNQVKS